MHRDKYASRYIASPTHALHVLSMELLIKMCDFAEVAVYINDSNNCFHIQSLNVNINNAHSLNAF